MKRLLFIFSIAFCFLLESFSQDHKSLRIEFAFDGAGLGVESEYAFQAGNIAIAPFLSVNPPIYGKSYWGTAIGARIYPFNVLGRGFYFCPFATAWLGPITENFFVLDLGYRVIIFRNLTGFLEAGGYMENNINGSSYNLSLNAGLGVAF